jgi:hypothetical protein
MGANPPPVNKSQLSFSYTPPLEKCPNGKLKHCMQFPGMGLDWESPFEAERSDGSEPSDLEAFTAPDEECCLRKIVLSCNRLKTCIVKPFIQYAYSSRIPEKSSQVKASTW